MDVDLILDTIFETYKLKAIQEGQQRKIVEARLDSVRVEMEEKLKEITDDFIGRPNNNRTVEELRHIINQNLNQFLDTEVEIESISQDADSINIDLNYRQKINVSGISIHGGVSTIGGHASIIPLQL
jgi:ribosome-associated toxin RatA of RatAB toxin-antitoxin module